MNTPIAHSNANHYHLMIDGPLSRKCQMKRTGYTLASLVPGEKGVIKSIDAQDAQVQRLMVLGLVEGTLVEHSTSAIGGDPMEFRLFGCSISLRREHARYFEVAPVATGD